MLLSSIQSITVTQELVLNIPSEPQNPHELDGTLIDFFWKFHTETKTNNYDFNVKFGIPFEERDDFNIKVKFVPFKATIVNKQGQLEKYHIDVTIHQKKLKEFKAWWLKEMKNYPNTILGVEPKLFADYILITLTVADKNFMNIADEYYLPVEMETLNYELKDIDPSKMKFTGEFHSHTHSTKENYQFKNKQLVDHNVEHSSNNQYGYNSENLSGGFKMNEEDSFEYSNQSFQRKTVDYQAIIDKYFEEYAINSELIPKWSSMTLEQRAAYLNEHKSEFISLLDVEYMKTLTIFFDKYDIDENEIDNWDDWTLEEKVKYLKAHESEFTTHTDLEYMEQINMFIQEFEIDVSTIEGWDDMNYEDRIIYLIENQEIYAENYNRQIYEYALEEYMNKYYIYIEMIDGWNEMDYEERIEYLNVHQYLFIQKTETNNQAVLDELMSYYVINVESIQGWSNWTVEQKIFYINFHLSSFSVRTQQKSESLETKSYIIGQKIEMPLSSQKNSSNGIIMTQLNTINQEKFNNMDNQTKFDQMNSIISTANFEMKGKSYKSMTKYYTQSKSSNGNSYSYFETMTGNKPGKSHTTPKTKSSSNDQKFNIPSTAQVNQKSVGKFQGKNIIKSNKIDQSKINNAMFLI